MSLKAILESLDDLDARYHDLYAETKIETKDGAKTVYVLQVEGIESHPKAKGLKTALEKERDDRRSAREEVKALKAKVEGLPEDFDPEEYIRLKAEADDPGSRDADTEKQIEAKVALRLKVAEDRWARERDKLAKERDSAIKLAEDTDASLKQRLKTEALTAALDAVGVTRPGLRRGALAVHMHSVRIEDDEGGSPRILYESEEGATVDLNEAISHWANTEDGKPYVTPAQGGGAQGGDGRGSGQVNPWKPATRNLTQQARITRENPKLAARFKMDAGIKS